MLNRVVFGFVLGGLALAPSAARAELRTATATVSSKEDKDDRVISAISADAAKLSTDEKKTRVESMVLDLRNALKRANELLEKARSGKDVVQLNCVNAKVTLLKGLLRISEEASVKFYDAIASNMSDIVNRSYTKIAIAQKKAALLRDASEQCVGEASVYTGDTEIEVEIDKEIGSKDPTNGSPIPPGPSIPDSTSVF